MYICVDAFGRRSVEGEKEEEEILLPVLVLLSLSVNAFGRRSVEGEKEEEEVLVRVLVLVS